MCSSYRHGAVVDLDGREENGLGDFDWRIFFFKFILPPPLPVFQQLFSELPLLTEVILVIHSYLH